MINTSTPAERRAPRATCPECGLEFAPRGLAAHRRAHYASGMSPAPTLPSVEARATPEIVRALEAFTSVVGSFTRVVARLDENIERLLVAQPQRGIAQANSAGETAAAVKSALERNLEVMLGEIGLVRAELDRKIEAWGGTAANDEQREIEQAAHRELGKLRRQQAEILFRLTQLGRNDEAGDLLRV
jgi:hypothetical protein